MLYKDRKHYGFDCEVSKVIEPASFFSHAEYILSFIVCTFCLSTIFVLLYQRQHQTTRLIMSQNISKSRPDSKKWIIFTQCFQRFTVRYSIVNSRYESNQFKLYLKGTFPNFVEARFFGSSNPETISRMCDLHLCFGGLYLLTILILERRSAIKEFLKFVVNNEVLCMYRALI